LNAPSGQGGCARTDFDFLEISVAAPHRACELVAVRPEAQLKVVPVDAGSLSALIERKSDIARVVLVWSNEFPRTMRTAENRVRVSAAVERAVGRERQ
jgi:hypothetical protein